MAETQSGDQEKCWGEGQALLYTKVCPSQDTGFVNPAPARMPHLEPPVGETNGPPGAQVLTKVSLCSS